MLRRAVKLVTAYPAASECHSSKTKVCNFPDFAYLSCRMRAVFLPGKEGKETCLSST